MLSTRTSLNHLFDDMLNWDSQVWPSFESIFNRSVVGSFSPIVDMVEVDGKIKYSIDLPGVPKENVSLVQDGRYLKITAERTDKGTSSKTSTKFSVSSRANIDTLDASMENGVLNIVFDVKETIKSGTEPKQIEIRGPTPVLTG